MLAPSFLVATSLVVSSSSAVVIDIPLRAANVPAILMLRLQFLEPEQLTSDGREVRTQTRLPVREPAIVSAIPPAISMALMIGETRSL